MRKIVTSSLFTFVISCSFTRSILQTAREKMSANPSKAFYTTTDSTNSTHIIFKTKQHFFQSIIAQFFLYEKLNTSFCVFNPVILCFCGMFTFIENGNI